MIPTSSRLDQSALTAVLDEDATVPFLPASSGRSLSNGKRDALAQDDLLIP